MAVTIIERPGEISFSRNPIRYSLQTDTSLATPGLKIDVGLFFKEFLSGGFPPTTAIIEVPLTPDSNGIVSIDFNKILDSLVINELPLLSATGVQISTKNIGQFFIKYRETTTASPSPSWTTDSASYRQVLKGGLPYQLWQRANYFVAYNSPTKPCLTWQKSGRSIGPTEKSWLSYIHLNADTTNVNAKVSIFYTDGTSSIDAVTVAFPATNVYQYAVYQIPVGIEQLNLTSINPSKTIHYYGVRIEDATVVLKENYYFYPDYRNTYSTTQFNYFNSLGGFDSVRLLGDVTREARYESEVAEISTNDINYNENELAKRQFTQQVTEQLIYKGSIGLMDDDYEMDVKRDLRISKGIYEAKYDRWWLVNLVNSPVNLGSTSDPIKDFPIEWTYGIENENYAPDIEIGPLPVCPVVTGASNTFTTVSWTGNAAHESYIVEVWYTSITIIRFLIYTTNTTVTFSNPGSAAVSYRIKAVCAGNNSEWV